MDEKAIGEKRSGQRQQKPDEAQNAITQGVTAQNGSGHGRAGGSVRYLLEFYL